MNDVSDNIVLHNNLVTYEISKNAEFIACYSNNNKLNFAARSHNKIAFIKTAQGERLEATKATLIDNILTVTIEQRQINLMVNEYSNYLTFEVLSGDFSGVKEFCYANFKFEYDYADPNSFLAAGLPMTLHTAPCFYPSGESKEVAGRCKEKTGFIGAKIAVVICEKEEMRSILKSVLQSIPKGDLPISTACGPFAFDNEDNARDCLMLNDPDPATIKQKVDFYSQWGIRQFNFGIGNKTFIQGQFTFPLYGSASEFKKQIVDPLDDAGIVSTLHTYSYYIGYNAHEILSNPKWQQQLEFRENFTLSKRITNSDSVIYVKGDKSSLNNESSFWTVHSPYLLIQYIVKNLKTL